MEDGNKLQYAFGLIHWPNIVRMYVAKLASYLNTVYEVAKSRAEVPGPLSPTEYTTNDMLKNTTITLLSHIARTNDIPKELMCEVRCGIERALHERRLM